MTGIYHGYTYDGSCGMGLLSTLVAPSLMSSTAASCSGGEAPTWLGLGLGLGLGLASCSTAFTCGAPHGVHAVRRAYEYATTLPTLLRYYATYYCTTLLRNYGTTVLRYTTTRTTL